jgi:hypothetical protein
LVSLAKDKLTVNDLKKKIKNDSDNANNIDYNYLASVARDKSTVNYLNKNKNDKNYVNSGAYDKSTVIDSKIKKQKTGDFSVIVLQLFLKKKKP